METNFEHYKDELIKALLISVSDKCEFINKYILPFNCKAEPYMTCARCQKMVKEWLDAPYIKPKIEIDWLRVPVDTPVYVWEDEKGAFKVKAHFSHCANGEYFCFINGATSWTTRATYSRPHCELALPEDIEKYRKK